MAQREVTATELKLRCGQLLADLAESGEPIIVTKRGRAVAKLVPVAPEAALPYFGFAKGAVRVHGDIMSPIEAPWEAMK
ncbi:MAG: type II toxin-antitoxin system prevent-host-death family antitoxin [Myxococcota bacterium]